MATRYMQTDFWTDSKVHNDSTPEDRYFMIYLLTNPRTNQLGCYEITIEQMSFDLGYKDSETKKILDRVTKTLDFANYDYETQEVLIKNWYKYNWTKSPKVKEHIFKELAKVKSKEFKDYFDRVCIPYIYPTDTIYIPYRYNYNNKNKYNYKNIYTEIECFFGRGINPVEFEIINKWQEDKIDPNVIFLAVKEAVLNQARSIKYIDKILWNWAQQNLKNENDVKAYMKKNKKKQESTVSTCDYREF